MRRIISRSNSDQFRTPLLGSFPGHFRGLILEQNWQPFSDTFRDPIWDRFWITLDHEADHFKVNFWPLSDPTFGSFAESEVALWRAPRGFHKWSKNDNNLEPFWGPVPDPFFDKVCTNFVVFYHLLHPRGPSPQCHLRNRSESEVALWWAPRGFRKWSKNDKICTKVVIENSKSALTSLISRVGTSKYHFWKVLSRWVAKKKNVCYTLFLVKELRGFTTYREDSLHTEIHTAREDSLHTEIV